MDFDACVEEPLPEATYKRAYKLIQDLIRIFFGLSSSINLSPFKKRMAAASSVERMRVLEKEVKRR